MVKRRRFVGAVAAGVALAALLAGCVQSSSTTTSDGALTDGPTTIRILAGSEVKDMVPILQQAESAIGVKVELEYSGTIAGTTLVTQGGAKGKYDATWFPNNRYLSLLPGASSVISQSIKIMSSPVVFGLKPSVASSLGWDKNPPTWGDLAAAASAGKFTYGMTNPAASNSGFSALVSVATALSGTGTALTTQNVSSVTPQLQTFFSGLKLTAGSSGFLADKFSGDPSAVDGIINYESVLKELKVNGKPLTIITPTDGVVTSDYPMSLLASAASSKKALYTKLTTWLRTTKIQKEILDQTHRRPGVPGISTGNQFPSGVLFETPFPNTLDVANTLISTYLEAARPPAQTIFLLDTSGSMEGSRLQSLQQALKNLAGADTTTVGGFAEFESREHVTLLPFNTKPGSPTTIDVPEGSKDAALAQIRDYADQLEAGGNTAIYDTLRKAYGLALSQQQADPNTFVSIVLMTDGENTEGRTYDDFAQYYRSLGSAAKSIPTFVVLFGDGNVQELTQVGTLTGGSTFNALNGNLSGAFQEIRGYQ